MNAIKQGWRVESERYSLDKDIAPPIFSHVYLISVEGAPIACVYPNSMYKQVNDARANLISAAPEILEALHGMVKKYTELVQSGDAGFWDAEKEPEVIAARAAIAKALGENH